MSGSKSKIIEKLRKKLETKKQQDLHKNLGVNQDRVVINGIPQPPIALSDPNAEKLNSMVEEFAKTLTPEQIAQYKKEGEHMYGYDYVSAGTDNGEAMEYIKIALRSGLCTDSLSDDEKEYLKGIYGDDWAEKVINEL